MKRSIRTTLTAVKFVGAIKTVVVEVTLKGQWDTFTSATLKGVRPASDVF